MPEKRLLCVCVCMRVKLSLVSYAVDRVQGEVGKRMCTLRLTDLWVMWRARRGLTNE